MSGPSFGSFQNTMDQITRVLPTAAVTGFHFIAGQISPDSFCSESQVRPDATLAPMWQDLLYLAP